MMKRRAFVLSASALALVSSSRLRGKRCSSGGTRLLRLSFSTSRTLRKCPCPITIGLPRARMRPSDRKFGVRLHLGNLFHLAPWKRVLAISGNVFRRPPAIFCRRGTFQPNSQQNTLSVSQYPSTSCPCRAWFYRRPSPLFRRSEAAVQKGLIPFQQALRVQSAQQHSPGVQPNTLVFPLLQPSPTGGRRWILVSQESPRHPGFSTHRMPSKHAQLDAQGRPGCPACAETRETTARSTPTAHRPTASAASSSQKLNSPSASSVST
jgi:hypothetical protein